jgi:hypothetical protein
VPVAWAALRIEPGDAGVRFLLAAAYAKLGLGTAAREELARLPEGARADEGVRALASVVAGLAMDEVSFEERRATCGANVEALAARGIELRAELERWGDHARGLGVLRTRDGNLVVRSRSKKYTEVTEGGTEGTEDGAQGFQIGDLKFQTRSQESPQGARGSACGHAEGAWVRFRDDVGEARSLVLPHQAPESAGQVVGPHVLEGIDPPWLLMRLAESLGRGPDGYWARITVVQADVLEFLDGLALADLRGVIAQERVEFLVGPESGARLAERLAERRGTQIAGPALRLATVRTVAEPRIERVLAEAVEGQGAEARELRERVREIYGGRDRGWWRGRYAEGTKGQRDRGTEGESAECRVPSAECSGPLRVLVPTCRYSTFVRHSAADLARSFEKLGWEARVMMEPDDHSHLSPVGYLRVLDEFRPDLVVLINYTRANLGEVMPAEVPFVCWVQDAMPHLFRQDAGRRQTEHDFLVGHLHSEFFTQLGYPRERTLSMPVVASAHKFHDGPVLEEQRKRLECELAYVSHHSETPEALHERLVREVSRERATRQMFERLHGVVRERLRDTMSPNLHEDLRSAAAAVAREELGQREGPPEWLITMVMNQYCLRLADRVIRHETLTWAAEVAERRGWRLKIFGRGWEKHPRFGKFAAGELEHGDELRASYRCAGAHLHASINWMLHQRVMECALSGGLPLCRLNWWDHWFIEVIAQRGVLEGAAPVACEAGRWHDRSVECRVPSAGCRVPCESRANLYAVADHPSLMRLVALGQRLGLGECGPAAGARRDGMVRIDPTASYIQPEVTQFYPREEEVVWLLGDLAETTFHSPATLEAALERAITRPAWRESAVRGIAARVGRHLTTDVLARGIVGLVERTLGAAEAVASLRC